MPEDIKVIIACGARKREGTWPAWDLYTGPYYRATFGWARSVVGLDDLYVLSAKYGLITARSRRASYEQRLDRRALPVARVRSQAGQLGLLDRPVTFVGGKDYADLLRDAGLIVDTPFGGPHMGIGKQRGLLRRCRGRYPTVDEQARYRTKGPVSV